MTRPSLQERQRMNEAYYQRKAKGRRKRQEHRSVTCAECGRIITQDVLTWGNGGDFGHGKACSTTCFEKMRNDHP